MRKTWQNKLNTSKSISAERPKVVAVMWLRSWTFWGINCKNSTKTELVLCWKIIWIIRTLHKPSDKLCSYRSLCFLSAVAEIRDPLGAPGLQVLPGLRDGSGWHGLVPDAGHQSLWTERVHTEMGGPLLLTSSKQKQKTASVLHLLWNLQQSGHRTAQPGVVRVGVSLWGVSHRQMMEAALQRLTSCRSAVGHNAAAGRDAWTTWGNVCLRGKPSAL